MAAPRPSAASPQPQTLAPARRGVQADCTYGGVPLYGKVEVVDFMADFDVKVVDFMADLDVQEVDFMPTSCGKWQFVDFMPDFSVRFVDFMPDFTIKFVDFMPGT